MACGDSPFALLRSWSGFEGKTQRYNNDVSIVVRYDSVGVASEWKSVESVVAK